MKGLFISGGATKFIGLASASATLIQEKKYRPKVIAGVSAGAIVAFMVGLNKIDKAVEIGISIKLDEIFSELPFNKKGRITWRALWNVLTGKNYLGKMGALKQMLKREIPIEDFTEYQENPDTPEIIVEAVNAASKGRKIWNLKHVSYETAINAVLASASIPVIAPPVKIDGNFYYDGGVRDHSPGAYVLEKMSCYQFDEVVSIYSRPENHILPISDSWRKNIISVFSDFLINTMVIEISKNDHSFEQLHCEKHGIKYTPIFIDSFSSKMFETNALALHHGYTLGIEATNKYYQ